MIDDKHELENAIIAKPLSDGRPIELLDLEGPVARSAEAVIFRATLKGLSEPAAIKCVKPEDCATLFSAQEKLVQSLSKSKVARAPVLYGQLPECGVIIMEWLAGPDLKAAIRWGKGRSSEVASALDSVAFMLSDIHQTMLKPATNLDTFDLLNDIALEIGPSPLPRRLKESVSELKRRAKGIAERPHSTSILHGDFKPANILIGPDRLFAIDAQFQGTGAIDHDIAHFLNQTCLELYHPRAMGLLRKRSAICRNFLSGCHDAGIEFSEQTVIWLRLQRLVMLDLELGQRQGIAPSVIWMRAAVGREIRLLTRELKMSPLTD